MIIIAALAEALTIYAFVTMFLLSARSELRGRRRGAMHARGAGRTRSRMNLDRHPAGRHPDPGLPAPALGAAQVGLGSGARHARGAPAEDRRRVRRGRAREGRSDASSRPVRSGAARHRGARPRQRIQEAVAEGQRVAAEIRTQAQKEATHRLARAEDESMREREKAKELLKEQMITLSLRRGREDPAPEARRPGAAQARGRVHRRGRAR